MTRDHMIGYPPTAREDFAAPEAWEHLSPYPFGVPNRVRDTWGDCEAINQCRRPVHVTAASAQCMTKGDVIGLQAQEEPQPAAVPRETCEDSMLVTVGRACIDHDEPVHVNVEVAFSGFIHDPSTRPMPEPATISEASRWPFAGCGWRNGDGGLGEQQERVRLEKLKEAEHQRWLAQQWAQPMYANEKGKP